MENRARTNTGSNRVLSDYLPQPQPLPHLHSFLLFIGQFLPLFLQLCFSAAKEVVQIIAARIDIRIVIDVFIAPILATIRVERQLNF